MLGLRLENTHVKYSGSQYDADDDKTTRTAYESDSYLNVLPSVLVKYDVMMISRCAPRSPIQLPGLSMPPWHRTLRLSVATTPSLWVIRA